MQFLYLETIFKGYLPFLEVSLIGLDISGLDHDRP